MLPVTTTNSPIIEDVTYKTLQHKMIAKDLRINGMCDDAEALRQSIYKILMTERYKYPAYSWDYGIYLDDLIGGDVQYAETEIESRIRDALSNDDRIKDITNFDITRQKGEIMARFTVVSIYGEIQIERGFDL